MKKVKTEREIDVSSLNDYERGELSGQIKAYKKCLNGILNFIDKYEEDGLIDYCDLKEITEEIEKEIEKLENN